jgi:hypothetical protein
VPEIIRLPADPPGAPVPASELGPLLALLRLIVQRRRDRLRDTGQAADPGRNRAPEEP